MPEKLKGGAAGEIWQQRLDNALRFRREHPNGENAWRRYVDLYHGEHWKWRAEDSDWPSSDEPRQRITVNQTSSVVQSVVPFLVRRNPAFEIDPARPGPEDFISAMLKQALLNYSWQEFGMQRVVKRATLDAAVIGHGITKTGYNFEVDESATLKSLNSTLEYRDYIRKSEPFISRVSPFNFVWDYESPDFDLDSARWCIEIIYKPFRDVVDNKLYDPKVRTKIKNGDESPTTTQSFLKMNRPSQSGDLFSKQGSASMDDDDEDDNLVLYEVWDKRTGKYWVFAHGVHLPLREEEEWPYSYLEGFPYKILPFVPVVDDPFPMGIPRMIEDQQHELNRATTQEFIHRRRWNRKYRADEGIPESEMNKLVAGEDGTVIVTNKRIEVIEDAPLSQDVFRVKGTIQDNITSLTGADELLRGTALPSRTTATEIGARQRFLGSKMEARIEEVDFFVKSVARQVLQHLVANYTSDQVIKVAGPAGAFWVRDVSKEDLQGEFDIRMSTVSAERSDPERERQQRIQLLQVLLSGAPMVQGQVDFVELFKWALEKFDDGRDMSRFFPALAQQKFPLPLTFGNEGGSAAGQVPGSAAVSPAQLKGLFSEQRPETGGQSAGLGGLNSELFGAAA